ncbi:hypothetical protein [Ruegeria arenilitoris]|uniref:hypothetical protein n=1 Tax=Ruegeria arenilitoris TaxID=1173585 RepID=UPI00147C1029|nr:hypothetical protein [Ruegeria arenilitoris]
MSEYVGFPRNDAEMKLTALPLSVLISYAHSIIENPEHCELIKAGWDRNRTSSWTDEQRAEQAWKEEELGEAFLKTVGYGGLYGRHCLALAQVAKATFKYLCSTHEDFESFILKEIKDSPFVKEIT